MRGIAVLSTALIIAPLATAQAQERLPLSLRKSIEIATAKDGNLRLEMAREAIAAAEARQRQARAALLPNIEGALSYQNLTRNLAAFGIEFPALPGLAFSTFAGPFSVVDARVSASQAILDLPAIKRLEAAKIAVTASKLDEDAARNQVIDQVARAYLAALRAGARLETQAANVKLAEALRALADSQRRAGTGTGIEVTRADVQLANEQQRLQVAENEHRRALLLLQRAMDLPLNMQLDLTDRLQFSAVEPLSVEQAIDTALATRPDWKAQQQREQVARLTRKAVAWERLPSVAALGDYGTIGTAIDRSRATRSVGVSVRVPIFAGGRRQAREAESAAQFRMEQVRTRDLQAQVELDLRLAFDALRSAELQVRTAEEGVALADKELEQAQRRYKAGLTSSLEITDAQTRLMRARENRIAALYQHNVARVELGTALGAVERYLP